MTPFWLKAHASYIDISHPLADHQLTFTGPDSALHKALLLKVPLVAEGQLPDETPLTVEITVTNNVSIGQTSDSDPKYGLSDGTNFTGFVTRDQMEYDKLAPCFGIAGSSGKNLTVKVKYDSTKFIIAGEMYFPEQFVFTLKLDKPWGSPTSLGMAEALPRQQSTVKAAEAQPRPYS